MTNTLPITVPQKFVSHKNLNKDGFNFVIWHPQISDWSQQTAICLPISWIFMIYTNINNWSLIQFAFCCMDRVKKGYLPLWVYSKIIESNVWGVKKWYSRWMVQFLQALIVSESYNRKSCWGHALCHNVLVNGDFRYLQELKRYVKLTNSLIQEVVKM